MKWTKTQIVAGQAVLLFGLAMAIRCIGITQDAAGDELYHVLAAKNFLADGTLSINGGEPYTRAEAFTLLIAGFFRLFGAGLVVGRIPVAIAGSLSVVVIFLWLRSLGERTAAWLAGLFLCFAPESLIISQQVRFYTLQQLSFLLGSLGVYALVDHRRPLGPTIALSVASAIALLLSIHLQIVSIIGIAGLALFVLLVTGPHVVQWARQRPDRLWIVVGATGLLGVMVGIVLSSDWGQRVISLATYVDLWANENAHAWRFYHWILQDGFPAIWVGFPLIVLVAASVQPRATLLSASVFLVAFVTHSFVSWKGGRYLEYGMPFFFTLGALALAQLVPVAQRSAATVLSRSTLIRFPLWAPQVLAVSVLLATVAFAIPGNRAFLRTAHLLTRDPSFTHPGMGSDTFSWSQSSARLKTLADTVDVLVSTEDTKALYYLGRLDYVIDKNNLLQRRGRPEFSVDKKIAVPMVSKPESIRAIIACHDSGLIVAQTWSMGTDWKVPPDTADYIIAHTERVHLPEKWGMSVFRWRTQYKGSSENCPPKAPTTGAVSP